MSSYSKIFRILDANVNRFCEGCRVIEDFLRFYENYKEFLFRIRSLRITMRSLILSYPELNEKLIKSRNINSDPGAGDLWDTKNIRRNDIKDLLFASFKRMEESARTLEEFSKIVVPDISVKFKQLRFKTYNLEQKLINKINNKKQKEKKK